MDIRKKWFRLLALMGLITLTLPLAVGVSTAYGDGGDDQLSIPEKTELKYPNLGSTLDRMAARVEYEGATSEEAAGEALVHQAELVAVTIYLSGNVADVVTFLEEHGGDPRNVGEDYIEAYVPVTLLGPVSERPGVIRVREIVPPQPIQLVQRITGHGPAVHGSEAWNQDGYSGQGVKVGIIDGGFKDLSSLMGTELPATVQGRCYTDIGVFTQNLADCEAVGEVTVNIPECLEAVQRGAVEAADHGTIVAESVIDIAPEVSLYIANPQSKADLQKAAAWMASEGVSVINHSVGWFFDGPGNGTSPLSVSPLRTVDLAVESDITWVNAAGNEAQNTWFGGYSNPDGNRAIRFGGLNDEVIDMPVRECGSYAVQLRWEDDWSGARTDLDLHLYNKSTQEFVFSSDTEQSGESGHFPFEAFVGMSRIDRRDLGIAVTHYGGDAPDWIQLTVWTVDPIQHYTKNGSISSPAESANPGMLAVGAAPWYNVNTIEPFSSRGPTPDGGFKPDIVGVDCGATALSPLNGFCGTSQASPHVAGMAALVRQRFASYTPAQVASYLKDNAEQRETPDPNHTWGHGFSQLPSSQVSETLIEEERDALVALYNATGGPNWTNNANWVSGLPVSRWQGVTTDPSGRVVGLSLPDNGLAGEIPSELGSLANLTWLILSSNQLTGEIPAQLGDLANLTRLYLWGNELSGDIPEELGSLTKLEILSLSSNQLTGEIRAQLGDLANLTGLYLSGNELSGEIPEELGSLTKLEELDLTRNQLTGMIPSELENLTSLSLLALGENQLGGEIPEELGSLTKLEELNLTRNQLTGMIPSELENLTSLSILALGENQLTGEIPSQLGDLANLTGLYLWGNELSGEIPEELGSLTKLEILSLSNNQLSDEIPAQLGDLANLTRLSLWGNELNGEIPEELGDLSNLTELSLEENQLTGSLPDHLTRMTALTKFFFFNNPGLCAPVDNAFQEWLESIGNNIGSSCAFLDSPEDRAVLVDLHQEAGGAGWRNSANWLSEQPVREWYGVVNDANGRVTHLFLGDNQLNGEIPEELGSLTKLEILSLRSNQLTGEIPAQLGNLTNLRILSLRDNQLTGDIPPELGSVARLEVLWLFNNQLTGEIPRELGDLANLAQLRLEGNQLSGAIPAELGQLANLALLYLSGNQLTGCVPPSLRDVADNDFVQLMLAFCTAYDSNHDGVISVSELFDAIDDYFDGDISISQLFDVIDAYFGPAPASAPNLVVDMPMVSDDSPDAGASFALSATVRHRDDGRSDYTPLR